MSTETIGYARVSTADQDLTPQLDALKQADCSRIFSDVASGARASRPELDKALSHLRRGDMFVVCRVDRLGRSLSHLVKVIEDLGERGVAFRSLDDTGMDTTTSAGRLVFHIVAAMADFERTLIRERTRNALKARKAQGVKVGRRPVVTPALLKRARQIIAKDGLTVREAAAALKIGKTALYNALKEPSL